MNVRDKLPEWWPVMTLKAWPGERFGMYGSIEGPAKITKLWGVCFGPRIFIGLVVTEKDGLRKDRK